MAKSTLDEGDENNALLAAFKGESGAGKSVAGFSFPEPYVFDFDRKMPSIARKHFPEKNIEYDTFEDIVQLDARVKELKGSCPYKTLIIDSYTDLGKLCFNTMAKVKSEEGAVIFSKFKGGKGEKVGLDYYFVENHYLNSFVDDMKIIHSKFKVNVLFMAHLVFDDPIVYKDAAPRKEIPGGKVLAQGRKPQALLPREVDNVFTFKIERPNFIGGRPVRVCYTVPEGDDIAKSSFKVPDRIEWNDLSFYDLIFPNTEEEEERLAIQNEGL